MSDHRKSAEVLVSNTVEDLYLAFRHLRGFRGADLGRRPSADGRSDEPCLRLHLSPAGAHRAPLGVPESFGDLPLEVIYVTYSPKLAEPKPTPAHVLTGGSACTTDPRDRRACGQVTLMVCERSEGLVGFLTSFPSVGTGADLRRRTVFRSTDPGAAEEAVGLVASTCMGRAGAAVFAVLHRDRDWLPIERPENVAITSLRRPNLGESLRAASMPVTVDGVGIYRIRRDNGTFVDIEGFRTCSDKPLPSGALVYDDFGLSGIGLATAGARDTDGRAFTVNSELARVMAAMKLRIAGFDDLMDSGRPRRSAEAEPTAGRVRTRRAEAVLGDPRDTLPPVTLDDAMLNPLAPNRRPDIATAIWPPLRAALRDHGPGLPRGITARIEHLDPTGMAREHLASAINASAQMARLGMRPVDGDDFLGCVTFDQVCERISDILSVMVD